jgi:hypothetical protein
MPWVAMCGPCAQPNFALCLHWESAGCLLVEHFPPHTHHHHTHTDRTHTYRHILTPALCQQSPKTGPQAGLPRESASK